MVFMRSCHLLREVVAKKVISSLLGWCQSRKLMQRSILANTCDNIGVGVSSSILDCLIKYFLIHLKWLIYELLCRSDMMLRTRCYTTPSVLSHSYVWRVLIVSGSRALNHTVSFRMFASLWNHCGRRLNSQVVEVILIGC